MSGTSILSADMTTVSRWLATGFEWWIGELSALVPTELSIGGRAHSLLVEDDGTILDVRDGTVGDRLAPYEESRIGRVLVPRGACLTRRLDLPLMVQRDLTKLVMTDADRLMPSPAGRMLVAARSLGPNEKGGQSVEVVGMTTTLAERVVAACREHGVSPMRVGLHDPADPDAGDLNFLPAMQAAGLVEPAGHGRRFWWAVVAFLVFANLFALIARDVAATDRIAQIVDEQQPAVAIADRMKRMLARNDQVIQTALSRRESGSAVVAMAIVAEALPSGAWVQRFDWHDGTIRLSGYKARGLDVIGAMRASPRMVDVRQASGGAVADIPIGQPFELTARVRTN